MRRCLLRLEEPPASAKASKRMKAEEVGRGPALQRGDSQSKESSFNQLAFSPSPGFPMLLQLLMEGQEGGAPERLLREEKGGFLGPEIGDALLMVIRHSGGRKHSMVAAEKELYLYFRAFGHEGQILVLLSSMPPNARCA